MPEMSAEQLKENLFALLVLGNETACRILADLPPQHLRRIEQAGRTEWLPVELGVNLGVVIHRAVGDEGLRVWSRAAVRRSMDGSIQKPLLDTAVRLFGLSPTGLFKMTPQGFRAIFRGAGELVVAESGATSTTLDLVGLPDGLRGYPFVLGIAGGLEAIFGTCKVTGEIKLVDPPPGVGARMLATWTAR
jgi:hypothetical protein